MFCRICFGIKTLPIIVFTDTIIFLEYIERFHLSIRQ